MKLWMRVYMLTLPLALAVLIACGARLLWVSYSEMIEREYARALGDHAMIEAALSSHLSAVGSGFDYDPSVRERALAAAARNYGRYYTGEDVALEILSGDGRVLFSAIGDAQRQAMALSPMPDGGRQYVIRRLDGRALLFVSGWLHASEAEFQLNYVRDISPAVSAMRGFARQISLWLLGASALLGAGLYLLIHAAMRPLEALNRRARQIARGDYAARIEPGQGEVGELAQAFNDMAGAVQQRVGELERAAEDRDRFVANLAHEMKTPMTTIIGYTELLQRANLTEDQRARAFGAIAGEGARLDALSRKLLSLFRIRGGEAIEPREADIEALLGRVADALELRLERAGVELKVRCELSSWPLDAELFQLLLMNLVENAVRATPGGGEIELCAEPEGEGATFRVADHGCGIPEDELSRVRQPFYMVDKQRARSQNGAGLGLTLCDAIAEAHGAKMEIASAPGSGTEVKIVFK